VIELAGELDLATAPHVASVLDRMMVIPDHIVIEAGGLTFIDSTGLRLLLRVSDLVGGRVELRDAGLQVRRLLEITGMTDRFTLAFLPKVAHRILTGQRHLHPVR
jgi:anti-sigma B factor antagonist